MFLIASQLVNNNPEFLKIASTATVRNIQMHVTEFSTELQNAAISPVTLLKSDFTADAVLKICVTQTGNIHLQWNQFSVKL